MAEQATHGFTRRSFIKGAAALTATGALVAAAPKPRTWKKPNLKRKSRKHKSFPASAVATVSAVAS